MYDRQWPITIAHHEHFPLRWANKNYQVSLFSANMIKINLIKYQSPRLNSDQIYGELWNLYEIDYCNQFQPSIFLGIFIPNFVFLNILCTGFLKMISEYKCVCNNKQSKISKVRILFFIFLYWNMLWLLLKTASVRQFKSTHKICLSEEIRKNKQSHSSRKDHFQSNMTDIFSYFSTKTYVMGTH